MFGVWLFLLAVAAVCSAQDLPPACPQRMAMKDFNATAYMGKWYEYAKFGSTSYEQSGLCVTAEYSLSGDNVTVVNGMLDNRTRDWVNSTAWASLQGGDGGEAKLSVHFPGAPVGGMYWVLNTDYENFSIVWACTERMQNITETSWILLRSRSASNETKEKLDEALQKVELPLQRYMMTEQRDELCGGAAGRFLGATLSLLVAAMVALLR